MGDAHEEDGHGWRSLSVSPGAMRIVRLLRAHQCEHTVAIRGKLNGHTEHRAFRTASIYRKPNVYLNN